MLLNQPSDGFAASPAGAGPGTYTGVLDAFVKTLRNDGPLALYNGERVARDPAVAEPGAATNQFGCAGAMRRATRATAKSAT